MRDGPSCLRGAGWPCIGAGGGRHSGQVGYEHEGVYVPHLETSVESLVKGFGCTLASMPANQNRVAFVRGPENLMLELIEA